MKTPRDDTSTERAHNVARRASHGAITTRTFSPEKNPLTAAYVCRACGGKEGFINLVRLIPPETDARVGRFLEAFDSLHPRDQAAAHLEHVCAGVEITFAELLGMAVASAYQHGRDVAQLLAAIAQPRIMERLIKQANTPKGVRDREMFLLGTGHLPIPRGATINVNAQATAQAAAQAGDELGVPDFAKDAQETIEAVQVEEKK